MDAASNNSVDDIRELRENVALAPMQGHKRVYILDEAHMLSAAAWNAFLKTLEEPPSHVVFVLATTEAHKVPATIVDRCHRFDFRRPSLEQIAGGARARGRARRGSTLPDAAVGMLARAATGSFRDALGTLEQLVTYGGAEVKLEDVLDILGVADAELVLDAAEALADHDPKAALLTVKRLSDSGRDFTQFMRDVSAHLRHLFVVQTLGEVPDSFSVTAEHTERLAAQAKRLPQGELLRAIDFLAAAIAAVKDGSEPRIQLEMALLKATQPSADLSIQALMHRIEQLESGVAAAGPSRHDGPARNGGRAGAGARAALERWRREPPRAAGAARVASGQAAAAVAVEEAEPATAVELDRCSRSGRRWARRWPRRTACSARRSRRPGPSARRRPPDGGLPSRCGLREEEGGGQPRAGAAGGTGPQRRRADGRVRASRRRAAAPRRLLSTRLSSSSGCARSSPPKRSSRTRSSHGRVSPIWAR